MNAPAELSLGREIFSHIEALAACSERPDALTRSYLTAQHKRAALMVMDWMQTAGMSARLDAVGNVVGRYEGRDSGRPAVILGSHFDTVADAGKFDGILGVVTPIACVKHLSDAGERLDFPIEVVAFADEEGLRFRATFIGSRGLAGTLLDADLEEVDHNGVTMRQALHDFGLDPQRIGEAARSAGEFAAYVEVHIEQGPVLDKAGLPVGVVSAISGATRIWLTLTGVAGHAGTVPMAMRHDALVAAAEAVQAVERRCKSEPDMVGTVGQLEIEPGAVNVIPGEARLSIDVRAPENERRLAAVEDILGQIEAIAAQRGLTVRVIERQNVPSCPCSASLQAHLAKAVVAEGLAEHTLRSGAGHDAMVMAGLTEVGMLFVRCKDGISHNPAESMTVEDADAAARVLLRFLRGFRPGESAPA